MDTQEKHTVKISKTKRGDKILKLIAAHESLISIEDTLSTVSSNVHNLRQIFDEATDRLVAEYEKEAEKLTKQAAKFLCHLDDRKHDENAVKNVIQTFPHALKCQDESDEALVPIQRLMHDSLYGVSFVPLLATEGTRMKVFSEGEKGGLASNNDPDTLNDVILHFLWSDGRHFVFEILGIDNDEYERKRSDENDVEFRSLIESTVAAHDKKTTIVLKNLFELNVLGKNDIIDNEMIDVSASSVSHERFNYLVNLCPEGLAIPDSEENELPIHCDAKIGNESGFTMLLEAGLVHFPRKLGFLFHRHPTTNERTLDMAMNNEGWNLTHDKLFEIVRTVIPPSDDRPILHDIIRLAPKYFSLLWKYYPDAIYLRDKNGRLPLHLALQRKPKWSHLLVSLIAINDPIDRHEKDPVTGLYPFMSAASGGGDLRVIYFLLRRDPNIWEGFAVSP